MSFLAREPVSRESEPGTRIGSSVFGSVDVVGRWEFASSVSVWGG